MGGFFGKTAGGVVAGYRAVRSDGLRLAPIRDAAVDGWRARGRRDAARFEAKDREALVRLSTEAAPATGLAAADGDGAFFDADSSVASFAAADPGAGVVRLRVRYQPLDAAALGARARRRTRRRTRRRSPGFWTRRRSERRTRLSPGAAPARFRVRSPRRRGA